MIHNEKNLYAKIEKLQQRYSSLQRRYQSHNNKDSLKSSLIVCREQIHKLIHEITPVDHSDTIREKKRNLFKMVENLTTILLEMGIIDNLIEKKDEGETPLSGRESGKSSTRSKRIRPPSNSVTNLFADMRKSIGERDRATSTPVHNLFEKIASIKPRFEIKKDIFKVLDNLEETDEDSSSSSSEDNLLKELENKKDQKKVNVDIKKDELSKLLDGDDSSSSSSSSEDELDKILKQKKNSKNDNKQFQENKKDLMDELKGSTSDTSTDTEEALPLPKVTPMIMSDRNTGTSTAQFFEKLLEDWQRNPKYKNPTDREIVDLTGNVRSYGVSADMNVNGMKRSKERYLRGFRMFDSDQNGSKLEMQDFHFCKHDLISEISLFAVFDGHLGSNCARELSVVFPNTLKQIINDNLNGNYSEIPSLWRDLYFNVDSKLSSFETQGSTGTTLLVWKQNGKRYLQCANVGDSFGFFYRNGRPISLTFDHKLSNPAERIRLLQMGVKLEANQTRMVGLNVSRAFGDHFAKICGSGVIIDPHVSDVHEIHEGDSHVVLASDGLWDVLSPEKVYEIISKYSDSKIMSHRVLFEAMKDPKCTDNITVVVISLN